MVSIDLLFQDIIRALQRWRIFSGEKIRIINIEESKTEIGYDGYRASIFKRII